MRAKLSIHGRPSWVVTGANPVVVLSSALRTVQMRQNAIACARGRVGHDKNPREARRKSNRNNCIHVKQQNPTVFGGLLINLIYPYSRLADLKCAQNES